MDATVALIDAFSAALPTVDAAALAVAMRRLLRGQRATLGGHHCAVLFGDHPPFDHVNLTLRDIQDHVVDQATVPLPVPLDPLPVALATFASIPLTHPPEPTTALPSGSRMPFGRNPSFVGCATELWLPAVVIPGLPPTVVTSAVVTDLGGIGATSVAIEFAYRYGPYFQGGVFWIACADPATVAAEVAACAQPLGLPVAGLGLMEQAAAVHRAWQEPIPRLLIFDGCDDPHLVETWVPASGGRRVVVTARPFTWPKAYRVRVGLLARPDSIALLQHRCPRLTPADADGLAEDLGDLPFALHIASSTLATAAQMNVEAYQAQLSRDHHGRAALDQAKSEGEPGAEDG